MTKIKRVVPTKNWTRGMKFPPGFRPVRYPGRRELSLPSMIADWLIEQGFAEEKDGAKPRIIDDRYVEVEPPEEVETTTEPIGTAQETVEREVAPAPAVPDGAGTERSSAPDEAAALIQFFLDKDITEISEIETVGKATAKALKNYEGSLTWEAVLEILSDRQLEAALKFIAQ